MASSKEQLKALSGLLKDSKKARVLGAKALESDEPEYEGAAKLLRALGEKLINQAEEMESGEAEVVEISVEPEPFEESEEDEDYSEDSDESEEDDKQTLREMIRNRFG